MGFILSKILGTAVDYDVPDDATGLSKRDKEIVQRTWNLVKCDAKRNAVRIFLKLFDQHPEYQDLFPAFSGVPRDQLSTNGRLLGHAVSVTYAITSLVDNLDDAECLVELLRKIGKSHKLRNVTAQHFQNLKKALVLSLEDILGPNVMNTQAKTAWNKTLEVANGVIIKSLEEEAI